MALSRYDAHQWFTIAPTVVHNIYLSQGSVIQTVKLGNTPGDEDKQLSAATEDFTKETIVVRVEQLRELTSITHSRLFVQVACDGNGISPVGLLKPEHAHGGGYGPHASVLIAAFRVTDGGKPDVLVYRRPPGKVTSPYTWDIFGGHVEVPAEQNLLSRTDGNDRDYFNRIIDSAALRELQEELVAPNFTWTSHHLRRYRDYGAFVHGLRMPGATNVEYSTLFAVHLPPDFPETFQCCETSDDTGETIRDLPNKFCTLDDLVELHETDRTQFADGLGRLLDWLTSNTTRDEFGAFLATAATAL
jgi:hypothetical protein